MTMTLTTTTTSNDRAMGEARVYNHYTKALVMTVDVDGFDLDEAFGLVLKYMERDLHPGVLCDIEIDQAPY